MNIERPRDIQGTNSLGLYSHMFTLISNVLRLRAGPTPKGEPLLLQPKTLPRGQQPLSLLWNQARPSTWGGPPHAVGKLTLGSPWELQTSIRITNPTAPISSKNQEKEIQLFPSTHKSAGSSVNFNICLVEE